MKKQSSTFALILITSAAIAAGCSSAAAPGGGTGGKGGGSGSNGGTVGTGQSVALVPTATGYLDPTMNSLGVVGSWYAYADSLGATGMPPGECQAAGHSDADCAKVLTPAAGMFANTNGSMCTTGSVEKVLDITGMVGMPDYGKMWGAGIGVDLNNDGITGKGVFNAVAKGVVGFSFDIDMKPAAGIRVEVQTLPTDHTEPGNDYWGATTSYPPSPVVNGNNVVKWSDIAGPKGHVFDPTMIEGIQFHVPTTTTAGGSFAYCISNLKLLK